LKLLLRFGRDGERHAIVYNDSQVANIKYFGMHSLNVRNDGRITLPNSLVDTYSIQRTVNDCKSIWLKIKRPNVEYDHDYDYVFN